jgi:WD40 repeat protein
MLPTKCIAVLKKHKDEVWTVQFSPSGKRLASQGKDNLVYLWSFTPLNDPRFSNSKSYATENEKNGKNPGLKGSTNPLFSSGSYRQPYQYRIKCTHEIKAHSD